MNQGHDDFASEPIPGLPERLPEGERILWQGAPDWKSLAVSAFHVWGVSGYFALLMVWRGLAKFDEVASVSRALLAAAALIPLAVSAIGLLGFLAWLASRSTVYTITNRRVVLRIGIALPKAINIPFRVIASAEWRARGASTGDITLQLKGPDRIGYAHLWPHVRPWRLDSPEPMLRSIPGSKAVAAMLGAALREANFGAPTTGAQPAPGVRESNANAISSEDAAAPKTGATAVLAA